MTSFLYRVPLLLALASSCAAADRALLIGVGVYADQHVPSLPGIGLDLSLNRKVLTQLGFPAGNIHTLMDRDATNARIQSEIKGWLSEAGAQDRVVFYFSGHGSLSRDVNRKVIGVLVPYNTEIAEGGLVNALGGPELSALLAAIPSRRVLIIVDACHSGHMTDSAKSLAIVPKFLEYPGMPTEPAGLDEPGPAEASKGIRLEQKYNHILLAACRRDEVAGATRNGSILTTALAGSVNELLRQHRPVTMRETYTLVLSSVQQTQHPEISGGETLADFDWSPPGRGQPPAPPLARPAGTSDWDLLRRVYDARAGEMAVRASKSVFSPGELMELNIDVPTAGYLNIISIGRNDAAATVLFPNQYFQDNRVSSGTLKIPNSPNYILSQEAPRGSEEDELLVLLTDREVNLYRDGVGPEAFRNLNERTRSTVVRPGSGYFAGLITYRIGR